MLASGGYGYQSQTLEGRLVELLFVASALERQPDRSSLGRTAITWRVEPGTGTEAEIQFFAGQFSLPAHQSISDTGLPQSVADPWLDISQAYLGQSYYLQWGPGDPSATLKAQTFEGALIEAIVLVQQLELDQGINREGRNYINVTWDANTRLIGGTFRLPVALTLNNGGPSFTVAEWLSPISQAGGGGNPPGG